MKILLTFFLLAILVGCASFHPPLRIDAETSLDPKFEARVLSILERSPTISKARRLCRDPFVFVEKEQEDGWVWINLYEQLHDVAHRLATMKLNLTTGDVLREEEDEQGEDKWRVENLR